ncbi:uncharacterized protein LOC106175383 [Lingula anatina]|uniref:Uncharacterized protein LOC106175383 n=1 Tax=Lingula anatina TaxID=7574 RepID=A0A1S3JR00_LINAN|nr:uncharacterized protein LOC106175383 [Lingula anatina]|eukprot:XP_013412800.1 uncharacterized protein LOC106175383 [Lingula anatina]
MASAMPVEQKKLPEKALRAGFENLYLKASPLTNKQHMRYKRAVQKYMLIPQKGPHKYAMLNLLGVLQYQDGKTNESIKSFESILKEDGTNLNALASLEYIYRELFCVSKAEQYKRKSEELMGGNEPSIEERKRRGRCFFEQGYMIAFDVHETTKPERRGKVCVRAHESYMQAWQEAGDLVDEVERTEWCFFIAHNLSQICHNQPVLESLNKNLDEDSAFEMVIKLFKKVIKGKDSHYKAQGWLHLGCVLSSRKRKQKNTESDTITLNSAEKAIHHHTHSQQAAQDGFNKFCAFIDFELQGKPQHGITDIMKKNHLEEYYNNPELCFLLAKRNTPKRTDILNRYAKFLSQRNNKDSRDFEEAKTLLLKSIKLDNGDSNWFAYLLMGDMFKHRYVSQWYAKVNMGKGQLPEKTMAATAQRYYKEAVERNPTPQLYANLAEISHFLGINERREVIDEDQMLDAVINFKHALESLDGEKDPSIHQRRGRCLRDFDQEKSAVESFKKAVETQEPESTHIYSFRWLIDILAQWCQKNKQMLRDINGVEAKSPENNSVNQSENNSEHAVKAACKKTKGELQYWFSEGCKKFKKKNLDEEIQRFWNPKDQKITSCPDVMVDLYSDLLQNKKKTLADRLKKGLSDLLAHYENSTNQTRPDPSEVQAGAPVSRDEVQTGAPVSRDEVQAGAPVSGDEAASKMLNVEVTQTEAGTDVLPAGSNQKEFFLGYVRKLDEIDEEFERKADRVAKTTEDTENAEGTKRSNESQQVVPCNQDSPPTPPASTSSCEESSSAPAPSTEDKKTKDPGKVTDFEENVIQKDLNLENKKVERCDSNSESIPPPPCKAKNKKGKLYDFYVIYSEEEDSDWVSYHLLTTLEGTKGFKGCVRERDFIPGTDYVDSIVESIKNSFKVLVIISGKKTNDKWYNYEVDQAIHQKLDSELDSFVIPICREDANKSDVPLKLKTVIACSMVSAHDWEKLERALDDDNSQ